MPYITPAQLATILSTYRLGGPTRLETVQSFEEDESFNTPTVEAALGALVVPDAQEVADDANVATVVTALKALGLFVDPPGP